MVNLAVNCNARWANKPNVKKKTMKRKRQGFRRQRPRQRPSTISNHISTIMVLVNEPQIERYARKYNLIFRHFIPAMDIIRFWSINWNSIKVFVWWFVLFYVAQKRKQVRARQRETGSEKEKDRCLWGSFTFPCPYHCLLNLIQINTHTLRACLFTSSSSGKCGQHYH